MHHVLIEDMPFEEVAVVDLGGYIEDSARDTAACESSNHLETVKGNAAANGLVFTMN